MLLRTRKRNRKPGFDYASDGLYFITSCVQGMACDFGEIIPVRPERDDSSSPISSSLTYRMFLNSRGQIAEQQWHWLEKQYPYLRSHAFIVMPNHIHVILEINRSLMEQSVSRSEMSDQEDDTSNSGLVRTGGDDQPAFLNHVRTGRDLSVHDLKMQSDSGDLSVPPNNLNSHPKIKSLSELIGAYKTTVSKQIHLITNLEGRKPFLDFA